MAGPYPLATHDEQLRPGSFPGATAPDNRYKEWFSWSVVASTASAAGLVCHVPVIDVNKVDVRLETWGAWRGKSRLIGLQLKATSSPTFVGSDDDRRVAFSLDGDDYNSLVEVCSYERFLVLIALPKMDEAWVRQRPSITGLCAAAWWAEVTGPVTTQGSKTVHLPVRQRFDLSGLVSMMEKA